MVSLCAFLLLSVAAVDSSSEAPDFSLSGEIDLTHAVVVFSETNTRHTKAAEMLQDEIAKRSGVNLARRGALPAKDVPAVVLGSINRPPPGGLRAPRDVAIPEKAEGYAI